MRWDTHRGGDPAVVEFAPAQTAAGLKAMLREWYLADTSRDWATSRSIEQIMAIRRLLDDEAATARRAAGLLGLREHGPRRTPAAGVGPGPGDALQPRLQLREHQQREPARLALPPTA